MKHMRIIIAGVIIFALGVGGFFYTQQNKTNETTTPPNDEKIQVMVSILPQVEFVEQIGGELFDVQAMIREGFSPATYEATPEQMKQLEDTDVYVRIGHIPFEKIHMDKIRKANPDMALIDSSTEVQTRTLEEHSHKGEDEDHSHEEDTHEDEKESIDPHIWVSPKKVQQQIETIRDELISLYPEHESTFQTNASQYLSELNTLDTELQKTFEPFQGQTMLVYHPAFGYLADDYGFTQEYIEIEGKEPSLTQVQEIAEKAQAEDVSVIFVQKQFSTQSAEAIAQEINGTIVPVNPLAQNYTENMRSIAQTITKSVE